MAAATATLFHSFPSRKDDHAPDNSGNDDSQIGLSITPNPSPHTTLTPLEAAVLSARAKCVVGDGSALGPVEDRSLPVYEAEPALLPNPAENMTNFLSNGIKVLPENAVLQDATKDSADSHNGVIGTYDAMKTKEGYARNEQHLEARIAQLEENLASLMDVCQSLMRQQQVRKTNTDCSLDEDVRELVKELVTEELGKLGSFNVCRQTWRESTPTTPSPPSASPPHRRFDTETELLSQWPPAQQPVLDSPEVSTRRRLRRLSSAKVSHNSKPSKTMSMLLLDIAPGESRGPSMIPFTDDLDEASGQYGSEKVTSSTSSSLSGVDTQGGHRSTKEFPAPPMLNEPNNTAIQIQCDATTPSPESSTDDSPSPTCRASCLDASLTGTPQENNLECQAYTSTHLEALRLRREAGKIRAYSFNDYISKMPEHLRHVDKKSVTRAEQKMPTISSPVQETQTFNVLQTGDKNHHFTESAETFVNVMSPGESNDVLFVPILSHTNSGNSNTQESIPAIPRKDSTASHGSTMSGKSGEHHSTNMTIRDDAKMSNNSQSSLRKSANILTQEHARSNMPDKDDTASTTSNALTVKSNNTAKSSEMKPAQEIFTDIKNKQTMKEYIMNDLLNIDSRHQDGSATEDIDANMEEFLRIPFKLEKLMLFSLAVCVDSFLYVWTMLPLKVIWGVVCLACTILRPGKGIKGIMFHRRHLYALLQCLLVWFVFYHVLRPISIGKLYHWIRGQAMLKLYVLIAIVEVFDRLLCSFGQDAWDSLYWNTTRRPKHPRMLVSMIVVGVYVTIHSLFLFVHVATLSVAVNSADNALLTLLISGNFAEIKSTVFKKYNKQNLFKITTSDICERFKLALFLSLILLLNCFQGEMSKSMVIDYYTMCLVVMVAEFISDWIKHSFITKFNHIPSTAYFDYALILSGDVTGIGHEGLNLDYTHAAVKRLGLAQIPLVCVTARYLHEAIRFAIAFKGNGDVDHPINALSEFLTDGNMWKFYSCLVGLMVLLVALKILLGVCIRFIARHNLGGDVIEMLERKKSSTRKTSTPKPSRDISSGRLDKSEGKKKQ